MAPLQRVDNCLMMVEDGTDRSLQSVSSTETNTNVQPPSKVIRSKKTVQFSQFSLMYSIPNLDSYTEEVINDSFLTDEDYDRIQMENEITLAYMHRGIYPDDDQLYFRGLENGMANIYAEKKRLAAEAVAAVLMRQAEKRDVSADPAWANAYANRFSYQSMVNAFRIGAWDAQASQQVR
ncbi:hypothetical protein IV203_009310 [Nitzschia inconspicua]|uniref:Uncharacterized protein n=1 Tax=Nitzschia inconspicua TaxID=303405 RepID=A0A9K3PNI5_9STRA|nr:hypothetical protein IV203_009310 [Nitzschia inconspicua]